VKKILPLIPILAVGMLTSCSEGNAQASNVEKKSVAVEGISIDLNNCTIGPNSVSFENLIGGTFQSESSSKFKNSLKNKTKIISDAILQKPNKTLDWGAVWEKTPENTGLYLGSSSVDGEYFFKLRAYAGQAHIKPMIGEQATTSEIESIFKSEIVDKHTINNGTVINYELLLCNKYKADMDVPTALGIKEISKSRLESYFPLRIAISTDSAAEVQSTDYENNFKSYSSGDRVCSTFGKSNWCGVVVKRLSGAVEVKVNDVNCGGML